MNTYSELLDMQFTHQINMPNSFSFGLQKDVRLVPLHSISPILFAMSMLSQIFIRSFRNAMRNNNYKRKMRFNLIIE